MGRSSRLAIVCALLLPACGSRSGLWDRADSGEASTGDSALSGGSVGQAGSGGSAGTTVPEEPEWVVTVEAPYGWIHPHRIAVDSAGNTIIAGSFKGMSDFGGGPFTSTATYDAFVLKLDAAGHHVWSKRYGVPPELLGAIPPEKSLARSMAVDGDDNIVLTGQFTDSIDFGGGPLDVDMESIFLAKLDPAGEQIYARSFGDEPVYLLGCSVAIDSAGNAVVSGTFMGEVDFGGGVLSGTGFRDIFLAKFDPSGNHLWSQRFGDGPVDQQGTAVAVDAAGGVALTGYYSGTVDFGGGPFSADYASPFVARFDPAGQHVWSRAFPGTNQSEGRAIAFDPAGDVVLTGYFRGALDLGTQTLNGTDETDGKEHKTLFVAKFDSTGDLLWASSPNLAGAVGSEGLGLAVDAAGRALLTGWYAGALDLGTAQVVSEGGVDVFVAALSPNGDAEWLHSIGGTEHQMGLAIALRPLGGAVMAGQYAGTVDFGTGPQTAKSNWDLFVATFEPY